MLRPIEESSRASVAELLPAPVPTDPKLSPINFRGLPGRLRLARSEAEKAKAERADVGEEMLSSFSTAILSSSSVNGKMKKSAFDQPINLANYEPSASLSKAEASA